MNTLVSLNQCAKLLGIPPMNLSRWVKVYHIPTVKVANVLAMRPEEVAAILIANNKLPAREDKVIA